MEYQFVKKKKKMSHLLRVDCVLGPDVLLEVLRHIFFLFDLFNCVRLRFPAVDFVQLEQDARAATFITEPLFLGAFVAQELDVEAAHFVLFWQFVKAA